ncbi:MAG: hypothetical protein WBD69_00350 [Candidatus Cybelea sp.]
MNARGVEQSCSGLGPSEPPAKPCWLFTAVGSGPAAASAAPAPRATTSE